jgi:hypothetical protein
MIPTDTPDPTRTDTVPDVENPDVESTLAAAAASPAGSASWPGPTPASWWSG